MTAEKRSFGMHPNLLFDVILRQAGSLQKAILEGVMNAIDAGATACHVTLEGHRFVIEDNGRGIQTRQEIEAFFETFGTPHAEGDAVYGRFRMGRGQMMAFGRNIWRSRTFEMDVDVKKTGLDYMLTEHAEDFQGTRITAELYEKIAPSELERTKGELRRYVAWAPIPVTLNGETISQSAENGKWTFEDEDAWYALSTDRSQLAVYNLGVLVNHFHAGRFGMGGTVVTKQRIDVNFARNDVQSSCVVFKRIQAYIKKQANTGAEKKTKLTDAERDMLARDFLSGDIPPEQALYLRVLTDVQGRTWPLNKLLQVPRQFSGALLVAQRGDKLAETAQNRGLAFTLDEGTLERFGVVDGTAFLARIAQTAQAMAETANRRGRSYYDLQLMVEATTKGIDPIGRESLLNVLNEGYVALLPKEMTTDNKILLRALTNAARTLVEAMNKVGYEDLTFKHRNIALGKSETALAWTDGTRNIWVDVKHARLLRRGYAGAHQLALTLLHEMLHTGPDTGTHQHDMAFYQGFHDISGANEDPVGQAAERMITIFMAGLKNNKRPIGRQMFARDDVDLALAKAREAVDALETADAA